MQVTWKDNQFKVSCGQKALLSHSAETPMIFAGYGQEDIDMYRGNFKINDYIIERCPLKLTEVKQEDGLFILNFEDKIIAEVYCGADLVTLDFKQQDDRINRFWFRVFADQQERCYGCGEQMSYFNLRGRHFPLWTSEPGVGRDKSTYVTWRSDVENKAGGDYYNTNFPQPTFVSTNHYYLHVDSTAYADFDFRNKDFHELQIWEVPKQIRIEAADTYLQLSEKLSAFLGRQPELPDWIYNGLIIGVQGGEERSFQLMEESLDKGIKVSAVWCQDWAGVRHTSFGKRLQWDWKVNEQLYPKLKERVAELKKRNIRFMNYINPYLVSDGELYQIGKEKGYFAKKQDGSDYLVDFGEFSCGAVDLTNPEAYEWFKNEVITKYTLDLGIDGWMADFGEYLPTDDIKLYNGESAMIEHNHWPSLWAKCNYDALIDTGKLGEAVYFMRAGGTGSQKYCTLLWAGDQSVDFSIHDGLATTICAALSAGMVGCGITHSDIGGYTSLFDNTRTKELFLRWAEMAMFTPVMRTHECNRPDQNFQYYEDQDTMTQLARMVDIYTMLAPYTKELVKVNAKRGIPVQRPLFMHYEADPKAYDIQYQYLYGEDMLIAPVYLKGQESWEVYLPEDQWIHLWSGAEYAGGTVLVNAPIGFTPAFYRRNSAWTTIFEAIREAYGIKK